MKHILYRIFGLIFMLAFCAGFSLAQVNTSGGFEDATPGTKTGSDIPNWFLGLDGGSDGIFTIVQDDVMEGVSALKFDLLQIGTNSWDVQIINLEFPVEGGTQYIYSVWIKADVEGTIVNFTVGNPSYTEWGRMGQVSIGTDWQEVTFQFTPPAGETVGRAPIHFGEAANAGLLPVAYWIDDLQIVSGAVDVKQDNQLPLVYKLSQNYPNPFNPTTTIEFSIPKANNVRLVLLNVMGEVVKEIASGNYEAGNHRVTLDGSSLATGVYFCRLEAGNFADIKKLVLMK